MKILIVTLRSFAVTNEDFIFQGSNGTLLNEISLLSWLGNAIRNEKMDIKCFIISVCNVVSLF